MFLLITVSSRDLYRKIFRRVSLGQEALPYYFFQRDPRSRTAFAAFLKDTAKAKRAFRFCAAAVEFDGPGVFNEAWAQTGVRLVLLIPGAKNLGKMLFAGTHRI